MIQVIARLTVIECKILEDRLFVKFNRINVAAV